MNVRDVCTLDGIDTPALVVDLDVMEANLGSMASLVASAGMRLRPHAKSHKSPALAWQQLRAGAAGITCQKLAEAEVMASAGIPDILVATPVVGEVKARRFVSLLRRTKLTTVVDSLPPARVLDEMLGARDLSTDALVEVDVGYGRCGLPPRDVAEFAVELKRSCPNLRFTGIMAYEGQLYDLRGADAVGTEAARIYDLLAEVAGHLRDAGLPPMTVSVGASVAARVAVRHLAVTEVRPGSYLLNDLSQVAMGGVSEAQCALRVLATVISVPAADRAVIDAGAKALTFAPLPGFPGYGRMVTHPDSVIARLADEHGIISVPAGARPFSVGERVAIIPNSHTVVVNEFSEMVGVRGEDVEWRFPIAARGCIQ